ncbi:MAG: 1,4-dihydroxy-2-naphthoate octaprenyltransferase [Burkholderiales bacterium]|nr:1,4-dihydroxy-2-naphthoate octaprenyltransferase [Burkholderiales bacterium]
MPIQPNSLAAWRVAIRPRSLLLAISPVLVGGALGFMRTGSLDRLATVLALAAALLMQLITNLQNDVGYTLRGGEDSGTRIGLPRATARHWLSVTQVRGVIVMLSGVAICLGFALVVNRGWPVLAMGSASLLAALAYMGGPKPIAYTPLGELTVFVYFGLVAVLGTDWLVTGSTGVLTWMAAISMGCLAAAALAVNNHRDMAHDREVGRSTFAARYGETASHRLLGALLALPFVLQCLMAVMGGPWLWLPCVLAPLAFRLYRDFLECSPGLPYNAILFRVFRFELGFALLLSSAALASS